jgi:nucleoside-diphosphate-sugar epimerase
LVSAGPIEKKTMSIFIVGCGYLGERVAKELSESGSAIHVLTRQPVKAEAFRSRGWMAHLGDWLDPESLGALPESDAVLIAVSHRAVEGLPPQQTHVQGLENLWKAWRGRVGRVVYISTTGVYSQDAGQWVDEDSICQPTRPGGIAALEAENWLQNHVPSGQLTVLRMAGLYGPGRIPNAERLKLKTSLQSPDHTYLNLLHIDDATQYSVEALQRSHRESLYLVSDGNPIPRSNYYEFLAERLGVPKSEPGDIESQTSGNSEIVTRPLRRSESNKRIRTKRLERDFSYRCRFADFRNGIVACGELT